MVAAATTGEDAQLLGVINFIKSEGLRAAEVALLFLGLNPGPIDGIFGLSTRGALQAFQAREGLPMTGKLDPGIESKLLAAAFPSQQSR